MLFEEFKNIVSILSYNFIEFTMLLYTFIWFDWLYLLIFQLLPTFIYEKAIANLWSIFFVNIFTCLWSETLWSEILLKWPSWANILGRCFPCICLPFGNIPLFKSSRTFCLKLRSVIAFLWVSGFSDFFFFFCGFVDYLMILISSFHLICCSSVLSLDELLICISMPNNLAVSKIVWFNLLFYYVLYKLNHFYWLSFLFLQFCLFRM